MNMYSLLYNINSEAFFIVYYQIYVYHYFTSYDEQYIPSNRFRLYQEIST